MKDQNLTSGIPYIPKIWAALGFFIIFLLSLALFWGRKSEWIRYDALSALFTDFYSHISNFSISLDLCLIFGYLSVLKTGKLRFVYYFSALMILSNIVYEYFIPLLNTRDPLDALYGIIGVLFALIFSFFLQKSGLQTNPAYSPP